MTGCKVYSIIYFYRKVDKWSQVLIISCKSILRIGVLFYTVRNESLSLYNSFREGWCIPYESALNDMYTKSKEKHIWFETPLCFAFNDSYSPYKIRVRFSHSYLRYQQISTETCPMLYNLIFTWHKIHLAGSDFCWLI